MAKEYLAKNMGNRHVIPSAVTNFTHSMLTGEWDAPNGEPIIFDTQGVLMDGQHRLHAIIQANKDIPLFVIRGIDAAKRKTIDTGKKRTFNHILMMAGEKHPNILSAGLSWLYSYMNGSILQRGNHVSFHSFGHAETFLNAHADIRLSLEAGKKMAPFFLPSLGVFLHYLFAQKDRDQADLFAQRIEAGVTKEECQPIYLLRERIIKENMNKKHSTAGNITRAVYGIRAWNAIRSGKDLGSLRFRPEAEYFPVPL